MQSEISKGKEDKYCMISLICGIFLKNAELIIIEVRVVINRGWGEKKKTEAEGKRGDEKKKIKYNVDCQGLEGGLWGSYCLMDAGFQFHNITRLLEVSGWWLYNNMNVLSNTELCT